MHLSEEQLIAVLCGTDNDAHLQHARDCAECGRAIELFRRQLDETRAGYVRSAERDNNFWFRQQSAIRNKIHRADRRIAFPRWAVAVAALAVLAAGLMMNGPTAPTVAPAAQFDPDYQLLVEIEQNLARPVPVAIEPATVLSADLNAAWQSAFAEHNPQQNAAQR
jgi:hypothetical protein